MSVDLRSEPVEIESISAVTLATHDMKRALAFYQALGFRIVQGGPDAYLTSLAVGPGYLNLIHAADEQRWSWWGRVIFHVSDVDAMYQQAVNAGLTPQLPPANATWGERYFHIVDPDGHELSFARLLTR